MTKRILNVVLGLMLLLTLMSVAVLPVAAVKPANNLAGAITVPWHLSADVMPVPPYGSRDIPGSDLASKLIVNQPNGNTEVTLTGVMKGLNPNTEYTVYLSKAYLPFQWLYWSLVGDWTFRIHSNVWNVDVDHYMHVTAQDGSGHLTGTGGNSQYTWTIVSADSTVTGTDVTIRVLYDQLVGGHIYYATLVGTIQADGSIIGSWSDTVFSDSGSWQTTSGHATHVFSGSTGWPGLFTPTVQPFTFTTDEFGAASWHLNLRDSNFLGPGTYQMSVWINEAGATILISDTFTVIVN